MEPGIHKIEKSSSPWLSFPENTSREATLKAQYYYTNHKFSVINGKIKMREIRIPQGLGMVSFDVTIQKRLRAQIGSRLCNLFPRKDSRSYSVLHADGSRRDSEHSITSLYRNEKQFYFSLPQRMFFPVK